ncbi:MAG: hypothetical protein AABY22_08795 [Nanoarchaeota archaeon]
MKKNYNPNHHWNYTPDHYWLDPKYWAYCLDCTQCKAKAGEPCRTPKGRLKKDSHDLRPFYIE